MRRGQALKVTRGASVVAFSIVPRINASGLSTYDRGWPGIRSGVAPCLGRPFPSLVGMLDGHRFTRDS